MAGATGPSGEEMDLYAGDTSWLDTAGRLLMVAFFLAVGLRNLQRQHIDDHVKRLTNFKAPFPVLTFWTGQGMELVGCALVLLNWHAAIGVLLLLVFTIVASALLLRFWEVQDRCVPACRTACRQCGRRRRPVAAVAARALIRIAKRAKQKGGRP